MPTAPSEPESDTILRNIRLVAKSGNFIIYIIAPMMFMALPFYINTTPTESFRILTLRQQCFLAVCVGPLPLCILTFWRADVIKRQLEEAGYVQRRTRERELDFIISFAPILIFLLYAQRYDYEPEDESKVFRVAMAFICVLMFWWTIVMISLGPLLWFTVRRR